MNREAVQKTPSDVLRDEHQVILGVLEVLERLVRRSEEGGSFEAAALAQCVEFLQVYADALHHAKEEDLLFPLFESRGMPSDSGLLGTMVYDHAAARELVAEMDRALDDEAHRESGAEERFRLAGQAYLDLLRRHINCEDHQLFPQGDALLSEEDQATLRVQFVEVGGRTFGGMRPGEMEQIAGELQAAWPGP